MNFLDDNGRIFKLKSYNSKPIGYEYNENKYIFWINSNTNYLSVNNFYYKIINVVIPVYGDIDLSVDKSIDINISLDSSVYKLVSSVDIDNLISNNESLYNYFNIDETDLKTTLTNDDLCVVKVVENSENYIIVPIYVIGCAEYEGSWLSNILIHVKEKDNNEYNFHVDEDCCSITVGGTYNSEYEELIINGKNMGINLPKDIIKAFYQYSFYDDNYNETLYNEKLKECLMNYSSIFMNKGNYNSVINSVNLFGYGKHITISKLLQTDNEFKDQFIHDYFNINDDITETYKKFKTSTFISLTTLINKDTGEEHKFNFNEEFYGENHPVLENLFDKTELIKTDNNSLINYIKPYYDYSIKELGLKLSLMKYYLEKYFLPIHLSIHSTHLKETVFMNDIKMINKSSINRVSPIINLEQIDDEVEFINKDVFLSKQVHYVDKNFNEYKDIDKNLDLFYINDTCGNIKIKFKNLNKYYNCVLLLERENNNDSNNCIIINNQIYLNELNLKIYDINYNLLNNENLYFYYTIDKIKYSLPIKGLGNFIENIKNIFNFKYKVYKNSTNNYYIIYNNENIILSDIEQYLIINDKLIIIPSINDLNINVMNYNDIYCYISIIPKLYICFKYDIDKIYNVLLNNENVSNNIKYTLNKTSELIYESHFAFYQSEDPKTQYNSFVIYPQIMSNISNYLFWVNSNFTIKLLVNNKWYSHSFKLIEPELNIDCGKLEYKYYNNDNNYSSYFNQLSYIDKDTIIFNSFMHNKELVEINNVLFVNEYLIYAINNDIKYIDGQYINEDDFYVYINLNGQKININRYLVGKDIKIPTEYLSEENLYIFVYNNYIYILEESGEHDNNFILKSGGVFIDETDDNNLLMLDGIYDKNIDYITLIYKEEGDKKYYICYYDEFNYLKFPLYEKLNRNSSYVVNRFKEYPNISNLNKYNNLLHLYDLYKESEKYIPQIFFPYNYSLSNEDKTLLIKFDYDNNKFIINGYLNESNKNLYTLDKLDTVYVYYKNLNENEIKYTDNPISIIESNEETFLGNATYKSINNFKINKYIESSLSNDVIFNEDNITFTKDNKKYNVYFKIKYLKYENNKYIEYIPKSDTFETFYKNIKNDNNNIYIISVDFFYKEYEKKYNEEIIYTGEIPENNIVNIEGIDVKLTKTYRYLNNVNTNNLIEYIYKYQVNKSGKYKLYIKSTSDNINIKYKINNLDYINLNDEYINLEENDIIYFIIDISENINYVNEELEFNLNYVDVVYEKLKYDIDNYDENKTNISINNYKYYYGDNSSKEVINLYNDFFKTKTYNINNEDISIITENIELNDYNDYNLYLMHDYEYWYVIFISKTTVNDLESNVDKEIIYNINSNKYKLSYIKSSKQFLINRMNYISNNGYNHFNEDDIIVMYLKNNDMLPVNIDKGSKWTINPISIGNKEITSYESNSDMCIMSMPGLNSKYKNGYYNITVEYSLDKMTQNIYNKKSKLLIK